ncbi:uncharacterized protein BCR38DRAFT_331126 [Pseudomassariella vexata]|uniref:Uncharacterized protein n=1 Tax=Pseudomassariella vexata TaxID=1141098 RepID=A0A1Y2EID5_9PEZI|nr:uncharacterized protein BCR38DRAFT_331126 [Pseudomassariella vexata]ORY71323.1 hypothetical protein BCR38DRAFT_331126 [Pseudomassariella vexata]
MCTYYYLHYHHLPPCARDIDYAVHYSYCPNSTTERSVMMQQPCDDLTYAPEFNPIEGIDYNNPCATGGCLVSQQCSSGGCRLEDLGNRWVCCQCSRGGNTFRWCSHPMKKVPDTLCYHVVCQNCWADS